jgi:formate dehydrogenase subunit beta
LAQGFAVDLPDETAEQLGLTQEAEASGSAAPGRAQVLETLVAQRTEHRDQVFADIRAQMQEGGVQTVFGACIRCHNCMTVCPICYCKTCLFKGPVYDHEPIQYMQWAEHKGALRLPSDTAIFHLTRMAHMALSCVGCGMCTSVCPADLPVGPVFRAVGDSVQAVFSYVPGQNPEEALPMIAFQENEWLEVGE